MNYLVFYNSSVFVAKEDPRTITQHILSIKSQKQILSGLYSNTTRAISYCQQVLDLLNNDFASGFTKIENFKQRLCNVLKTDANNAAWIEFTASDVLIRLQESLTNYISFDNLPQCNIPLSVGRDLMIEEIRRITNIPEFNVFCSILSLGLHLSDYRNATGMFWFYNTIITCIGETPQYPNEQNILHFAKAQRAYAFLAAFSSAWGGVSSFAHIINEATARLDIGNYGQQPLSIMD